MIDMLSGHGADIVKIAGDAVIAVWQGLAYILRIHCRSNDQILSAGPCLYFAYLMCIKCGDPRVFRRLKLPAGNTLQISDAFNDKNGSKLRYRDQGESVSLYLNVELEQSRCHGPAVWQVNRATRSAADTATLATAVCLEMTSALDEYVCQGLPPACTLR
jgi:hypothetical protein